MKKIAVLLIVSGAIIWSSAMASHPTETAVIAGNSQFTNNFYKVLAKEDGNVFFSPISAHTVLSMAYLGAGGTTAEAFKNTLHVPDAAQTAEGYKQVITRLNSVQNVTLLTANKVYVMQGHKLADNFQKGISEQYLSDLQSLNFGDSVNSAKTINQWVEEKTKDKIKDLIKPDDLDGLTRLVLVNAIYFKGNWLHKFNKDLTKTEPFYINNVDTVDVQMMHINKKYYYKNDKELDAQVLELPYTDRDLSMIIILPNKRDGIKELEQKLANVELHKITERMWETEVNLALPKFKLEKTLDLQNTLTELGLGVIFDQQNANFKGMLADESNLYVSKAVQKAFIEVNEEGAEAAAATGMVFMPMSAVITKLPPPEFIVDHPFIFKIKHQLKTTSKRLPNNILFMGKISNPSE